MVLILDLPALGGEGARTQGRVSMGTQGWGGVHFHLSFVQGPPPHAPAPLVGPRREPTSTVGPLCPLPLPRTAEPERGGVAVIAHLQEGQQGDAPSVLAGGGWREASEEEFSRISSSGVTTMTPQKPWCMVPVCL